MPRSTLALTSLVALLAACAPPRTAPTPVGERAALRAAIDSMVATPQFRNAHWGILIVDPERGDTLYSRNAGKLFMPASNQKILTGAVALAQLGPEFTYGTALRLAGAVRDSVLLGDLQVYGMGDPSISDALRGDAYQFLRGLADSLRARGVRRIDGTIVSASDAFSDAPLGFGWAWDDLDYPYSAGTDELMFNEGFGEIIVSAGAQAGDSARVRLRAPGSFSVRNEVRTVGAAANGGPPPTRIQWEASADARAGQPRNGIVLRGTIRLGDTDTIASAFRDQNGAFLDVLAAALRDGGIEIGGRADSTRAAAATAPQITLASPPLRTILARMEKPSQNQIAEALYKTLPFVKMGVGTADSARAVVERQLVAWGAPPDGFAVRDGSGLSRHDYVTPETIVKVLDAMRRHEHFRVFYDALPIAGVDGTIRNRMRGTPAEGNVHAKTGFIDKARSLSGYVTTADGRVLLFSFLANNWTTPTRAVEQVQDAIAARLASMRLGQ
ncbi:MAG TPA: D-alanyl-D-alanine carboxypeptidase/D-alanyl-D-alanine-endopeptidase [Gemmatimonadaceae bacterium]|nr:D-alanyl-D-alanine carboxypeptidase/D-alanyl-D-alanine-endopeptidase [Gemmatimonadaceae bacterium]